MKRFRAGSHQLVYASRRRIGAAILLTMACGTRPAQAAPVPQALRMSCSSDDMRRHVCPVDTSGGVQMVHQKSEAKCIQNRTWGYDNRGIWVDRGCRAEFEVGVQAPVVVEHGGRQRHPEGEFPGRGGTYLAYSTSHSIERPSSPTASR